MRTNQNELQMRVGAWVQARRLKLGMSQGDVRLRLGYQSTASVSNIEQGRTAIALRRAYAWAEVLEVDRTAFLEFATGLRTTIDRERDEQRAGGARLTRIEASLVATYRALSPVLQRKLRAYAAELAVAPRGKRKP